MLKDVIIIFAVILLIFAWTCTAYAIGYMDCQNDDHYTFKF